MNDELNESERKALSKSERIIEQGSSVFLAVGHALAHIRDNRLYRNFGTFEQYCRARHDLPRDQVTDDQTKSE